MKDYSTFGASTPGVKLLLMYVTQKYTDRHTSCSMFIKEDIMYLYNNSRENSL